MKNRCFFYKFYERRTSQNFESIFHQVANLAEHTLTAFVENEETTKQVLSLPQVHYENRLLNKKQLAERLGISVRTVSDLQTEGLPTVNLRKRVLFDYEEVLTWAKEKDVKNYRKNKLRVVR